MFFGSIKCINWLLKERNRLLSKGISNIYLKITIEKKRRTQNFDSLSLKSSSSGQFLGRPNSHRYHWILKILVATSGCKTVSGFSIILTWKGIMTI